MGKMNIYQRKDGRWEGRIPQGKKADGKRRFRYVFGHSKEQVSSRMNEIRQSLLSENCRIKFRDLFSEWYEKSIFRIKESTAANYLMKARKHLFPSFGDIPVSDISSGEITEFIQEKQKEGLSPRYICDIIVLIKSVFKYAATVYKTENPTQGLVMPRRKSAEISLLNEQEQEKLQKYISGKSDLTSVGIALCMSTGIRIGELCALKWEDIDLKKRILTVRKTIQRIQCNDGKSKTKLVITEPKTEASSRKIPLPEGIMNLLGRFKSKDSEYVLSGTAKPVEPRTMQYRFSKILKNVNLPSVHFHALRHIFASNCISWGFDIKTLSELLGHSSVEITLNRYVHSSFERKIENMRLVKIAF